MGFICEWAFENPGRVTSIYTSNTNCVPTWDDKKTDTHTKIIESKQFHWHSERTVAVSRNGRTVNQIEMSRSENNKEFNVFFVQKLAVELPKAGARGGAKLEQKKFDSVSFRTKRRDIGAETIPDEDDIRNPKDWTEIDRHEESSIRSVSNAQRFGFSFECGCLFLWLVLLLLLC